MLYPQRWSFVRNTTSGESLFSRRSWVPISIVPFAALCSFLLFSFSPVQAHDIISTNLTYSREVSRIFARRCVSCHSAKDSIPLTNYAEVRPWAVAIKEQVLTRAMPPWGAVKGFGDLANDRALSQEEVMTIAEWVIGGAPEGSRLFLPPAQTQSSSSSLNRPEGPTISVNQRLTLSRDLTLNAVRPQPSLSRVPSVQVTAHLPDGEVIPLVWLFGYESKWNTRFLLRRPLHLPAGTVVESSVPLSFRLEAATDFSQAR